MNDALEVVLFVTNCHDDVMAAYSKIFKHSLLTPFFNIHCIDFDIFSVVEENVTPPLSEILRSSLSYCFDCGFISNRALPGRGCQFCWWDPEASEVPYTLCWRAFLGEILVLFSATVWASYIVTHHPSLSKHLPPPHFLTQKIWSLIFIVTAFQLSPSWGSGTSKRIEKEVYFSVNLASLCL